MCILMACTGCMQQSMYGAYFPFRVAVATAVAAAVAKLEEGGSCFCWVGGVLRLFRPATRSSKTRPTHRAILGISHQLPERRIADSLG